jgi:hypothetical protein
VQTLNGCAERSQQCRNLRIPCRTKLDQFAGSKRKLQIGLMTERAAEAASEQYVRESQAGAFNAKFSLAENGSRL